MVDSVDMWLRTEFPFYGSIKSWLDKRIIPQTGEVKHTTFTVTVLMAYLENCPLLDVEISDSLPSEAVLVEGERKWKGKIDQGIYQVLSYKMKFNHGYGLLRLPPAIANINGFKIKSNAPLVLLSPPKERLVVSSKLRGELLSGTPQAIKQHNRIVVSSQGSKKLSEETLVRAESIESSLDKEGETTPEVKEDLKTKIIAHAILSAYEKIRRKKSEEEVNYV
ncbi:hypothetical protein KEJ26_02140 [Candidatus Bathyarchaeota archaeon]|nr:hypothetical protein [Candidatus Bathyarchaeota archaeon]